MLDEKKKNFIVCILKKNATFAKKIIELKY